MKDDELVTHEQVARWLPAEIRFAIDPHEHRWISTRRMDEAFERRMCTYPGCVAEEIDQ